MQRKKILLVDDSGTALMIEKTLLGKAAYDLVTARDGIEAVEKARAELPDLILMDLVMPRMTGFDAARELRAGDATRDIPIIMVTTRSEAINLEEAFAIGVADYVTKPINSLELLEKLRNILGE